LDGWATRQFTRTLFRFVLSHKIQKFLTRNFGEEIIQISQMVNWLFITGESLSQQQELELQQR